MPFTITLRSARFLKDAADEIILCFTGKGHIFKLIDIPEANGERIQSGL